MKITSLSLLIMSITQTMAHKADAEFLNRPLEHFKEMLTIFGNSMATEKHAKDSSEALGTEDADIENDKDGDGTAPLNEQGASSSVIRRNKRAKFVANEDDGLVAAFKSGYKQLATAIEKAGSNGIPDDLFEKLQNIPGFEDTHRASYFAYKILLWVDGSLLSH